LRAFFESNLNIENQTRKDLTHTPYLVLLFKYLKQWQQENNKADDCLPINYKEKAQLKALIKEAMNQFKQSKLWHSDENSVEKELELDNFEEAIKAVNTVLVPSNFIPSETKAILEHPSVSEVMNKKIKNMKFWLLVKSLKEFLANKSEGCLPVRGSLPDMTSDSDRYVKLQKIYSNKAKEDADAVQACLQEVCGTIGMSSEIVSDNTLKKFCKNAHFLRVHETSAFFSEFANEGEKSHHFVSKMRELVNSSDFNGDGTNDFIFYLMIRSVMRFVTLYSRFPGYCSDQVESDINTLKSCFKEFLSDFGLPPLSKDDYIHEMCRYGGCELHSISSFLGGCIAHEIIKLITSQYVPIKNTVIYNAMNSTTTTFDW
ncbi:NEDD8-activating enzyme E1 regulatory subunit-like protein, partial [Dinothrombium tinctorium]